MGAYFALELGQLQSEYLADGLDVVERKWNFVTQALTQVVSGYAGGFGEPLSGHSLLGHGYANVRGEGPRKGAGFGLSSAWHWHSLRPLMAQVVVNSTSCPI